MHETGSPADLLISFYGDDFTGSTDAMEALTRAGLRTVLFLEPPTSEQLRRFEGLKAVGVAGASRSMSPQEMEAALTPVFKRFRELNTPIVHYKICSTFDSSPEIGSIGCAAELGQEIFGSRFVPLLVGAPILGRYCIFGNLFARSGLDTEPFRLDRHPTMRHHPITPMGESDLRIHLSHQTTKKIELFDILRLAAPKGEVDRNFAHLLESHPDIVLFDVLDDEHLPAIGRLIWNQTDGHSPLYVIGSSGVEYALTAHWRAAGLIPEPPHLATIEAVEQLVVVSGSCSPVTARQMEWALEHGFVEIALQTDRLVDPDETDTEIESSVQKAFELLAKGKNVILHTGKGPRDPRIPGMVQRFKEMGYDALEMKLKSGKLVGEALARILQAILRESRLQRAVVVGGDTSAYVAPQVGIEALEMIAPTAPGSPLCRVYASEASLDDMELVFKGGQVGKVDYFGNILHGMSYTIHSF